MSATKQTQAVSMANELLSLAGQLQSILFTAQGLSQRYGNQGIQAVLNALPTRAQNADGSLGTPDVSPVAGNPINTDAVTGLNRACKASELIAVKNIMNDYITFMTNATVAAAAQDRTVSVDKVVGG
jgi:hypothetical protein